MTNELLEANYRGANRQTSDKIIDAIGKTQFADRSPRSLGLNRRL
jgi:hypothetical protein